MHHNLRFNQPYYRFGLDVESNGKLFRVFSVSYGERCPEVQTLLPEKYRLIARPQRDTGDRYSPIVLSRGFETEKAMDEELQKGWEISGKKFNIEEAGQEIIDAMLRMEVIEEVP